GRRTAIQILRIQATTFVATSIGPSSAVRSRRGWAHWRCWEAPALSSTRAEIARSRSCRRAVAPRSERAGHGEVLGAARAGRLHRAEPRVLPEWNDGERRLRDDRRRDRRRDLFRSLVVRLLRRRQRDDAVRGRYGDDDRYRFER